MEGPTYTQDTEGRYKGYKTLWEPYTQWYPTIIIMRRSQMLNTTLVPRRTIYFKVDGNYKTPYFMKDDYGDDYEHTLSVKKSNLLIEEMLINKDRTTLANPGRRFPSAQLRNKLLKLSETKTVSSVHNTSCYVCGLDLPGIPRMPSCYHVFESKNGLYSGTRNKYKRHCYNGTRGSGRASKKKWYGNLYRDGCFKRFTDVGDSFNERGCREMKPVVGISIASKRFAKLERMLYKVDEGCVFSPMASLTPFSRAISLYVRYHVCVCKGKYCNRASNISSKSEIIMLSWLLFYISNKCFNCWIDS